MRGDVGSDFGRMGSSELRERIGIVKAKGGVSLVSAGDVDGGDVRKLKERVNDFSLQGG